MTLMVDRLVGEKEHHAILFASCPVGMESSFSLHPSLRSEKVRQDALRLNYTLHRDVCMDTN